MDRRRSMLVTDLTIAASDVKTFDLPVNPLGHIWLTLKGLNVTDECTLAEFLARLSKITVSIAGQSIYNLSGADLFAWNCIHQGREPIFANRIVTDNATRYLTMLIPFGRKLFDAAECHPATRKGEFQLKLEFSATETAVDGLILSVGTVELLDASPTRCLKLTTLTATPAATGDFDLELPIGNPLAGVLLWGTTVVTTTAWTNTIESLRLLIDNVEDQFAKALQEDLHGDLLTRCGYLGDRGAAAGDDQIVKYIYLDFSPDWKDDYLVETAGRSSVKLRIVAGDTNPLRVLPVELMSV